jgi:site-specific DNA-methyltransferase (adenine-specific)/adenine-specific DNA-methyltransferase
MEEAKLWELDSDNRVWWGKSGNNSPRIKKFLSEAKQGMVPTTWWTHQFAGTNSGAKTELRSILGDLTAFMTPKPKELIQRILQIATNPGDLVLDSFGGSGTTGHAVLQQNKDDDGGRRFILVEIDAKIAAAITAERVRRVSKGYTDAKGEAVPGLGGGFTFAQLGKPLFDEIGAIRLDVKFAELAEFVFFRETGRPLPRPARGKRTALLGTHDGRAVYLLFNGILGDRRADGGNVLTSSVLATLTPHQGAKVIYAAACRLGRARLAAEQIMFKQTPYDLQLP